MSDDATLAERLYPSMAPDRPSNGAQTESRPDGQTDVAGKIYDSRDGRKADDGYVPYTDRMGEDGKPADDKPAPDKSEQAKGEGEGESFDLDGAADELGLDREHEAFGDLKEAVADLNLDKAGAEKLVSAHARANEAEWSRVSKSWTDEVLAAPDADAVIRDAQALVRSNFIDPEFRQYLADTPFGNHPGLIRSLAKIKRALNADDQE